MTDLTVDASGKLAIRSLDPDEAEFLRAITTFFGMHRSCAAKVCRRARACATRQVVCYQAIEKEMKPIVRSIGARMWARAVARGEKIDVSPAGEGDMRRLLASEEREMAKSVAGEYGGEDELTPYRLWLKRLAEGKARDTRRPPSSTLP